MTFSNGAQTFHTIEDVLAEQITAALSNLIQGVVLLGESTIEGIKTHILGISSTEDFAILQQIQKKAAGFTDTDLGELRSKATWQDATKLRAATQTFITDHIAVEGVNVAGIMATPRLSNNFAEWAIYAFETASLGASTPRSGPTTPRGAPKPSPTAGTPQPSPAGAPPAPTTPPAATAIAAAVATPPSSPPHPGASKSPASTPAPASPPTPERSSSCCC